MTSSRTNLLVKVCLGVNLLTACVVLCGCEEGPKPKPIDKSAVNAELINTFNDVSMRNAIISQHTLYPYHFVQNADQLNELGKRDLSILAGHFKDYPGQLNVRREGASDELYKARVSYVADELAKSGVGADRVSISDGMPGGSGMASEQVVNILESDEKARSSERSRYPQTQYRSTSGNVSR
jgi:hypothetical protein